MTLDEILELMMTHCTPEEIVQIANVTPEELVSSISYYIGEDLDGVIERLQIEGILEEDE
jgi:hypothetical protein